MAKSIHSKHSIVNAILYVLKTACQWRMLAHDLSPWQIVYDHYHRWKKRWIVERTFAFWLMPKMDRNIFFIVDLLCCAILLIQTCYRLCAA